MTGSYAQIGHGSLNTTSISQDVQGQITLAHVGGDLTLTGGGTWGNNYAQIGHADNGVGAVVTSLSGDVLINDVAGTIQLIGGTSGGSALIGHSAVASSNVNTYSGKVVVNGSAIQMLGSDTS